MIVQSATFSKGILEISIKGLRISGSVSGSLLKAVLDTRIRLQTHYPAGYPAGKPDTDHLCYLGKHKQKMAIRGIELTGKQPAAIDIHR